MRLLAVVVASAAVAWSCATAVTPLTCTAGQTSCSDICVDTKSDPDNCGGCNTSCPIAQVCVAGACAMVCPSGNDVCTPDGGTRGFCVDTKNDNLSCGKCGNACKPGQSCVNGTCASACSTTQTLCTPDGGGATYCAALKTDNANCGACGAACPPGELCSSGTCVGACTSSQTVCDAGASYCADLQSDNANCGTCGMTCGVLQVCTGGTCTSECSSVQTACTPDGGTPYCASTETDNTNCGTCGNVCPSSKPVCNGGTCSNGSCNHNALVLGDGDSSSNSAIQTAMQNVGFTVTLQSSGTTSYAGSPAASGYGVVWVGPALTYATDMPAAGQTAIVNASTGGIATGVIFIEWAGFEVYSGRYQTLKSIELIEYSGYDYAALDFTLNISGHPIWNGLATSFTTSTSIACTVISSLLNGGTTLASSTACGIGVAITNPTTTGRVVDLSEAGAYNGSTWYNDTNMTKLIANAALWAARCD